MLAPFLRPIVSGLLLVCTFILLVPFGVKAAILPDPRHLTFGTLNFAPPHPYRITLANGLRVFIMENRELPVVKLTLLVKSGAMYDEAGKEGVAEMTASLMRMGGTVQTAPRALDRRLDQLAATIEPSAGLEQVQWSLFSLRKDFLEIFNIFSDIIRRPRFDEGRRLLLKDIKSEEIRRITDEPQTWAFKEFNRLIYSGNPRGRLPSLSSLRNIGKEDLEECHSRYYTPDNMIMAVSGDIDIAEFVKMVQAAFGDWQAKKDIFSPPPPYPPFTPGKYYLLKDTPQTIIVMGQPAPEKMSASYYAFAVIDYALGSGGFNSLIFQKVRTDLGLAYAAGSFYRARRNYGVFGSYAITKTASADMAFSVMQDTIRGVRHAGLSSVELKRIKKAIDNRFIFAFDSPQQLVISQAQLSFDGLPEDFLWQYRKRIGMLSVQKIQKAAKGYLDPDHNLVLMLGSEAGYEAIKKKHPDFKIISVNYD